APRSPLFPYTTLFRSRVPDLPPDLRGSDLLGIGGGVGIALGGEADLSGAAVGAACDDAVGGHGGLAGLDLEGDHVPDPDLLGGRSEEHTSELQSRFDL